MNKKLITSSLIACLVFSFALATSASAFWPFDVLFRKGGEVKAETTEKSLMYAEAIISDSGSKAYMTYQTLVSMNDACRRMLATDYPTPTRAKYIPRTGNSEIVADKKLRVDSADSIDKEYLMKYGIESRNERELLSIFNSLKARCENIASLVSRMQKIYRGNIRPTVTPTTTISCGGVTGKRCPDGYACLKRTSDTNSPGTCVKIKEASETQTY